MGTERAWLFTFMSVKKRREIIFDKGLKGLSRVLLGRDENKHAR